MWIVAKVIKYGFDSLLTNTNLVNQTTVTYVCGTDNIILHQTFYLYALIFIRFRKSYYFPLIIVLWTYVHCIYVCFTLKNCYINKIYCTVCTAYSIKYDACIWKKYFNFNIKKTCPLIQNTRGLVLFNLHKLRSSLVSG